MVDLDLPRIGPRSNFDFTIKSFIKCSWTIGISMVRWESNSSRPPWKGYQSKGVANHSNCCDVRWNVCNGTYSWLEKDVEDFEKTVGMCSNAIFAISGKLYTNITLIGDSTSRLDYNTVGCRLFFTISAFLYQSLKQTND